METKQKTTLTQGSVARGMLLFALPIFISNLFQQLYNAADSLIVGNFLGGEALAAVGSSGSLIFLLTGFVNGVSLGAGVVVARYFGAKDWDRMRRTIHTTVALGLVAGVGLTVIGVILTPQILRWMGTPDDVLVNSIAYFRMYFIGSIAVVMYNVGASILQSVGDSKSPMRYLIAASLINIVLDLILVGWLRMGVAAAAFATIASQTVSAVLAFAKLTRSQEAWAVHWSEVKFDGPSLKAVIVQGLPSGIQNSVISIANVIVQSNINSFGAQAMAGCGAYSKVEGFAFLPVTCFAMALATFVSQNVGAGQPDHRRFQPRGRRHRVRRAAGPHHHAVLLPAGVQPLLRGHPARSGPPRRADDGHAGGLVSAAHHLHHGHAALHPRHRRCVLGLSADLEHLVRAVCMVYPPLPHPQAGRRRTGGQGVNSVYRIKIPPSGMCATLGIVVVHRFRKIRDAHVSNTSKFFLRL